MVTKQENICDNCGKRVAENKCVVCQKDLCSSCIRNSFNLIMRSKEEFCNLGTVTFCRDCKKKMIRQLGDNIFDEDFSKETCQHISNYIIKKMMIEGL